MNASPSPMGDGRCSCCGKDLDERSVEGTCAACLFNLPTVLSDPAEPVRSDPLPPPSIERLREVLPNYEIVEKAGKGGQGAVFFAKDRKTEDSVAIKAMTIRDEDSELAERFDFECRTMAALKGPYVPHIYEHGSVGDVYYLIMEWMPDGCLQDRLTGKDAERLRMRQVVRIMRQLCNALTCAHDEDTIHRDVKPSNILIDGESIRLTDFGLAKRIFRSSGFTELGVCVGTPGYMAPEQEEGDKVDHRADIYAAGVVLYFLLTMQFPRGHMPKMPSQLGSSNVFDDVVRKAMAEDPNDRYQDAASMKKAIRAAWLHHRARKWSTPLALIVLGICAVWKLFSWL